jgi:hypothetical protein
MAKVEVKPIIRKKWHNKTGKEDFSKPKVIEVLYDDQIGGYATGLTAQEEEEYGKLMGVRLDNRFNPEEPHPYWSAKVAAISLPNHTLVLDTSKASDYVKVKNLKASKYVANSQKEYEEGLWPFATHVIFDEAGEADVKASKIQLKKKAIIQTAELSKDAKIALIQVIRNKNLKGKTDNFVDVELDDVIEKEASEVLKYLSMGREEVTLRAQVLELIQKNVLTKQDRAIFYMGDRLAEDYEAALEWFRSPENNKTKIMILEKLNR